MSAYSSRGWLSLYLQFISTLLLPYNARWLSLRHTSVYFLVAFHWAPLLGLFPIILKWINSAFEFIIRENMDFTNEITYSWQSTALKMEKMSLNFLWFCLSGLKLLVVNPLPTEESNRIPRITFFKILTLLYCFHLFFVQFSLLLMWFISSYSFSGKTP